MTGLDRVLAVFLILINLAINWRIFLPGITPYRGSIERGYAYMAKLVAASPSPFDWNPMQYCGLPTHFVYLPLLPYWNALWLSFFPQTDPTQIHRTTAAFALCAAAGGIYFFARYFGSSRAAAFSAGLALTLFSPLYLLIETIEKDRGLFEIPWRVQVLIKYGEGPHTVGLALLPLALIAVHRAATVRTFGALFLAAAALAAVVLTNWVAGLALALCTVLLLLIFSADQNFSVKRVLLSGLLGYTFAAFWLTPTFILRMAGNWPKDAFGYQFASLERYALIAWLAGLAVLALAARRFLPRYLGFLLLATYGFGVLVTLFYRSGINIIPESRRYALEYELFLLLLIVELFRLSLLRWRWPTAFVLLVLLLNRTPWVTHFVGHHYAQWIPVPREDTSEYQVAAALAARQPQGRLFLSGGSRFRFNSWFPYPQVGGIFETGLRNRLPVDMAYQIRTDLGSQPGEEAANSILQLRTMGVEYVVVHGPDSQEYYRDFKFPNKFEGVLEKVWSVGDDRIYRLPSFRYAHLVKPSELPAYPPKYGYFKVLEPYVNAQLDSGRPTLAFAWQSNSTALITGPFPPNHQVALSINYEDGWHATQSNQPLPLTPNQLGFFTVTPSTQEPITLAYRTPLETKFCALLSALSWFGCLLYWRRRHA